MQVKLPETHLKYIELISKISEKNESKLFWATWLPAKNRFNSPILNAIENNEIAKRSKLLPILAAIKSLLYANRTLVKSFFIAMMAKLAFLRHSSRANMERGSKPVYIIKTFAYHRSFCNNEFIDPFFGKLREYLEEKGHKVITIFDPIDCSIFSFFKSRHLDNTLPFYAFLSPIDFLWVLTQLMKALFTSLKGTYLFNNIDISDIIRFHFNSNKTDSGTAYSLLMFRSYKRIFKKFAPKSYIYTYENNPWERMGLIAAKEAKTQIETIGYQHNVIPLASLNLFPSSNEFSFAPFPDKIVTTSALTAEILKSWAPNLNMAICPGAALRYSYLDSIQTCKTGAIKKVLLVVLEGVPDKALNQLNYILDQINDLMDWKIVIRTHPALPLSRIMNQPETLPTNIATSSLPKVYDDLLRSDILLYSGSTVALEGLAIGLPIIFFNQTLKANHDPLFDFNDFKWVVDGNDRLLDTVNAIRSIDQQCLENKRLKASSYISDYFTSPSDTSMASFSSL